MGESGKSLVQTRWVVFASLVIAVVALCLAGYAALLARGNATDIADHLKAGAAQITRPASK